MENQKLYEIALAQMNPIQLRQLGTAGHVACALESIDGNIYTGICIDMPCSIGLCAEQSAIAEMLKKMEKRKSLNLLLFMKTEVFFPHAEDVENLLVN